jgi:cytochrome P450
MVNTQVQRPIDLLVNGGPAVHGDVQQYVDAARADGVLHRINDTYWCIGYDACLALLHSPHVDVAEAYGYFSGVSSGPMVDFQRLWVETSTRELHARRRALARIPFADETLIRTCLIAADEAIDRALAEFTPGFCGDFAPITAALGREMIWKWAGVPVELSERFVSAVKAVGATVGQPLSNEDPALLRANELVAEVVPELVRCVDRHDLPTGFLSSVAAAVAVGRHDASKEEIAAIVFNVAFDTELIDPQAVQAVAEFLLADAPAFLAREPQCLDRLVWELVRLAPASPLVLRRVVHRVEVDGTTLEPGQWIVLHLAAAWRDPVVFEDPGAICLERKRAPVFGVGAHSCLGSRLAWQVVRMVIVKLLARFEVELDGPVAWLSGPYRGVKSLPFRIRSVIS